METTQQNKKSLSSKFLLALILVFVFAGIGWYTYQQVLGNTTINKTITSNPNLESGLVGHWTFDGKDMDWSSSTAEVLDKSGNGNNGDATNFGSEGSVLGKIGQALYFDGANDYVRIPNDTTLQITEDMTISFWTKLTNDGNYQGLVGKGYPNEYEIAADFRTGKTSLSWRSTNSDLPEISSFYDGYANKWIHVTAVVSGTDILAYRNGTYVGTMATGGSRATSSNFVTISTRSGSLPAKGSIDDVRIYNRALSAEEIMRLYELGGTTHINKTITSNSDLENNLVGHWTFDGSLASQVIDRSGNGNHGRFSSTTATSTIVVPGKIGQAIELDGTIFVEVSDDASLDVSSAITVASWVRHDSSTFKSFEAVLAKGDGSYRIHTCAFGACVQETANNAFGFSLNGPTGSNDLGSGVIPEIGRWYHVVGTYDGSTHAIYIDRVLKASQSRSGSISTNSSTLDIGRNPDRALERTWVGRIDDTRVYNRALSPEEISRLYDLGATTHINTTITSNDALDSGLVGHWTFDGKDMDWSSSTAEVLDRSGNGNRADALGFDSSSTVIGKIGQAIDFDGVNDYVKLPDITSSFTDEATLNMWMKSTVHVPSIGLATGFVELQSAGCGDSHYVWYADSGIYLCTFRDDRFTLGAIGIADRTEWHMVTITNKPGADNYKFYQNGIERYANTGEDTVSIVGFDSYIGTSLTGEYYYGKIDDVRIYNRALSAEEVKRLYELGS